MKLQSKLTLFNTVSKLVLVVLFVLSLPYLVKIINLNYTDSRLKKQKNKVIEVIKNSGIKNYVQNDNGYASYTLLKEDYISIEEIPLKQLADTIEDSKRLVQKDTIQYRVLTHTFTVGNKNYLLEIGKSTKSIGETTKPLQSIALQVLLVMIALTILADLLYTRYLLAPLNKIIKSKLLGKRFLEVASYPKVRTTTTDFKYLDESIHQLIEHIQTAFNKEREFISNASHELMTPVSILQTKIENMFSNEELSDEIQMRLLEMQKTLNRLKTITKTLLLISQIENEQFVKEDLVSVKEILQEVYDEIYIRLEQKKLTLKINIEQDVILIQVNKFLLFNLFFNLINNAIKYNKEGGEIAINSYKNTQFFTLEFKDNGLGIPSEQLPFIFNRFKKVNKASSAQESFGLGLPIVKSIADFHNIQLDIQSEVAKGTSFKLHFPLALVGKDLK